MTHGPPCSAQSSPGFVSRQHTPCGTEPQCLVHAGLLLRVTLAPGHPIGLDECIRTALLSGILPSETFSLPCTLPSGWAALRSGGPAPPHFLLPPHFPSETFPGPLSMSAFLEDSNSLILYVRLDKRFVDVCYIILYIFCLKYVPDFG